MSDALTTVIIAIPPTDPTSYASLKSELYAWRVRHQALFQITWKTHGTLVAYGVASGRQAYRVVIGPAAVFDDLPVGIFSTPIPPLEPEWSLAATTPAQSPTRNGATVEGTRHFLPNAEVYLHPKFSGDGYERVYVTGRHKSTGHFITIMQPTKRFTNWRAAWIEDPIVLLELRNHGSWADRFPEPLSVIQEYAALMKERIGEA